MSRWNSRRCSRRGGRTVEEYEVVQVVEPVKERWSILGGKSSRGGRRKVEGHVEVEQFEMEILSREMTEIERTRQTIDDTRVVSTATKVKTNTQVHEYTDS